MEEIGGDCSDPFGSLDAASDGGTAWLAFMEQSGPASVYVADETPVELCSAEQPPQLEPTPAEAPVSVEQPEPVPQRGEKSSGPKTRYGLWSEHNVLTPAHVRESPGRQLAHVTMFPACAGLVNERKAIEEINVGAEYPWISEPEHQSWQWVRSNGPQVGHHFVDLEI